MEFILTRSKNELFRYNEIFQKFSLKKVFKLCEIQEIVEKGKSRSFWDGKCKTGFPIITQPTVWRLGNERVGLIKDGSPASPLLDKVLFDIVQTLFTDCKIQDVCFSVQKS